MFQTPFNCSAVTAAPVDAAAAFAVFVPFDAPVSCVGITDSISTLLPKVLFKKANAVIAPAITTPAAIMAVVFFFILFPPSKFLHMPSMAWFPF
ncbi:hypothetical protein D3C74_442750 [compost metagenome]